MAATGRKTYKRKKKRRSRTLLFSVLFLAVLGLAVVIYQMVFNARAATVSMTATPISVASTYINTGDGLLYQTDGQIHFYHLNDSRKNYTYGVGASDIRMSGSAAMTVVFNEASLQVVGRNQPISFPGRIREVECGTDYLAVLLTPGGGTDSLIVITVGGAPVDQMSFGDQYIVDFGFYKTGSEMLWIETLNVNSGTPTTSITTYDLSKKAATGVMHVQNQLVDELYLTSNSIFVVGTNQIIRYTHSGNKEVYRVTIYGYEVMDFSSAGNQPTFLLAPRGGDFHSVKILRLAEGASPNAAETFLQLPMEGIAAFMMGDQLAVTSREKLLIYTLAGKLSSEASFEISIDEAVKLTDRMLLLSAGGLYYTAKTR